MINELFLYDRDNGLFKEILKQSVVINGRYHLCPDYGHELNTGNLNQYFKDEATGLTDVAKYPCCVCITPNSNLTNYNQQKGESFVFQLYFLTLAKRTADNQIRAMDRDTLTSMQHTWYDWLEMKNCAASFLETLHKVLLTKSTANGLRLRQYFNLNYEQGRIRRLTNFSVNQLNGASMSFTIDSLFNMCSNPDYDTNAINDITIPTILNV